ncbi:MAG: hypothetical protein DHS80DRAFT_17730 [Piptocephalis tieghemiana]|nr:MAG: hypothetical protein DHS80DRAFT_17730 [Piptocephalis tieghemiana]
MSNNATSGPTTTKPPKRRKVAHACVYCRRSHMTCDEGRPCQRCIKRSIGHLCHDEYKNDSGSTAGHSRKQSYFAFLQLDPQHLSSLLPPSSSSSSTTQGGGMPLGIGVSEGMGPLPGTVEQGNSSYPSLTFPTLPTSSTYPNPPAPRMDTKERYFLTAADPSDGTLENKLLEVINAKYEAGLLKPFNYVSGYTRLQEYMDTHMSALSRQRILSVVGTFRPAFRAIAQTLTDIDLVLVEENFERLLLDYDRVFSAMGIPACLWRRTGEIYKANREFADLVDMPISLLQEGKTCIYELMAEESAVNYWEKYGNVAFDAGQKAVLTSCLLLRHPTSSPPPNSLSCCFSFTIRRDKYNIPTLIAGNFLPVSQDHGVGRV